MTSSQFLADTPCLDQLSQLFTGCCALGAADYVSKIGYAMKANTFLLNEGLSGADRDTVYVSFVTKVKTAGGT